MCLMIESALYVPSLLPDYIVDTTKYHTSSENWVTKEACKQCGLSGIVLKTQLLTCTLRNRVGPKKEKGILFGRKYTRVVVVCFSLLFTHAHTHRA